MNKFAMVTRCDSKAKELGELTHPILQNYAKDWGCDFLVLGDEIADTGDFEMNHYRILEVEKLFEKYERVLIIDSDVVIMPGTPNPFDIVPYDKIGSVYEDVGSRQDHRRMIIKTIQEKFGDVSWSTGYINTGFFICSKEHRRIFEKIDGQLWDGFGYDDALVGYNINRYGYTVHELGFQWNHMQMFSEMWNNQANRFDSFVIHYAGAAVFPDDLSDRKDYSNALSGRIDLIKNDIDRIAEGLMTFTNATPTAKQGLGSTVYSCNYGVQGKPIILKVSKTQESFDREVENLAKGIPNAVYCLGKGTDPKVGSFLMLEVLEPLPDEIDSPLMDEIIYSTLEILRYCHKYDITWIPRLDHIGLDENGAVRFMDFGDDPYDCPSFYGNEKMGSEGVLMDGETDKDGNYIMRYTYPLSGFRAIMKYLIKERYVGIEDMFGRVAGWEHAMIVNEYQSLKDVHQPINHSCLSDSLRTESEADDINYGKLVPANRECTDRALMLSDHLPSGRTKTGHMRRWLDIGCNVGWFQHEFNQDFAMIGIEIDQEKVDFAQMISDLNHVTGSDLTQAEFRQAEVDLDFADAMGEYHIISAFSVLHLKLIEDKDAEAFWVLLEAICSHVKEIFFFEFPPHSWGTAGCVNMDDFMGRVQDIGKFTKVEQIGITDARRPMLKCSK